jgi:DNA-binding transcriptional ArsR family regulator
MSMLDALASPARQEMVSHLGEGPATVRELALALGRTRQALHYHVALLEKAGLVKGTGWRGTGTARERVYAVTRSRMVATGTYGARDRASAQRAVSATLRLTSREVARAFASPGRERGSGPPTFAALRGKARLTVADLRELHDLFGRIEAVLRRSKQGRGRRYYAVTLVLVPSGTPHRKPKP